MIASRDLSASNGRDVIEREPEMNTSVDAVPSNDDHHEKNSFCSRIKNCRLVWGVAIEIAVLIGIGEIRWGDLQSILVAIKQKPCAGAPVCVGSMGMFEGANSCCGW